MGKGVSYCAICDGSFYRGKKVAVLGGGDTALDDAAYLAGLAEQVYVIHRRKEFRGAVVTVEKLKEKENVTFVLEHQVKEITGKAKVTGVALEDGTVIDVDGVFVAFGSVPQTALVKDLVELDPAGCESRRNRRNQSGRTVCGRRCQNKETAPGSDSGFRWSQRSNSGG